MVEPAATVADAYVVYPYWGNLNLPGPNALRENDTDPENDGRSIQSFTQPSHGTVTYSWTYGSLTYSASGGYSGNDSFTYQLCDSLGMCSTGTVYLLVIQGPVVSGKVPTAPCPTDPSCNNSFNPTGGGLSTVSGGTSGASGPSAPDPVDLATGRESYMPEPGLPPEWKPDPTHLDPNGQRFRHPGGDILDFHPRNPLKSPKTKGGKGHGAGRGWACAS